MEVFRYLDRLTKPKPGLYPLYVIPSSGAFKGNDFSIGALGDSFYEYMIKLWLFTNKQANGYRRMYEESAEGMISELVKTSKSGFRYMSQISGGRTQTKMEHLVYSLFLLFLAILFPLLSIQTCFSGGMFALGAITNSVTNTQAHMELAGDLTKTCHESYDRTATKIGPEAFEFGTTEFTSQSGSSYYILRPGLYLLCLAISIVTNLFSNSQRLLKVTLFYGEQPRILNTDNGLGKHSKLSRNTADWKMVTVVLRMFTKYLLFTTIPNNHSSLLKHLNICI